MVCGSKGGPDQIVSPSGAQISRGEGFEPAKSGTSLKLGDRVLAGNTAVRVALGPACTVTLAPHTLTTITQQNGAVCASSTASVEPPTTAAGAIITPAQAAIGLGGLAAVGIIVSVGLSGGGSNATTVSAQ